jgi:hypothetical protein
MPVRSHTFSTHTRRLNVSPCTKCYVLSCRSKYTLHQMLSVHLLYHVHYPPIIRGLPVMSHTFSTHTPRLNVSPCTFLTKCYVLSCLAKYILLQILGVRLSDQVHLLIYSDLDNAIYIASILTILYFRSSNGNVLSLTNVWTCWSSLVTLKYIYDGKIPLPKYNPFIRGLICLNVILKHVYPLLIRSLSILIKKCSYDYINIA